MGKLTKEEFLKKVYEKNEHVRNGEIEIRGEYNGANNGIECYCNIHDKTWYPIPTNLYKGYGCRDCGIKRRWDQEKTTHEEFVKKAIEKNEHVRNGEIKILGTYTGIDNSIECYCVKHDGIWFPTPYTLYQGHGCKYCDGTYVLRGFNDLWTTDPDIATLLTNPEDGYLIARTSHEKKSFTCPLCGEKQEKFVLNVTRRGLQCRNCSDHISFPNRFSRAFFSQLPVENYDTEYSPDWLSPYSYDNYFEYNGQCYVEENDGGIGHGNKQWGAGNKQDIDGKERDMFKDKLASENGITVIRIDTKESDCEYIKKHILESKLAQIFDLSHIDWEKCEKDAQKNLVKEVCDLYMSGIKRFKEIACILKISPQTVYNYLKRGAKFGWCNYDPKITHANRERANHSKSVVVTKEDNKQQFVFKNVKHCESELFNVCGIKASHNTIKKYCRNKQLYNGFYFNFIDKTIQN